MDIPNKEDLARLLPSEGVLSELERIILARLKADPSLLRKLLEKQQGQLDAKGRELVDDGKKMFKLAASSILPKPKVKPTEALRNRVEQYLVTGKRRTEATRTEIRRTSRLQPVRFLSPSERLRPASARCPPGFDLALRRMVRGLRGLAATLPPARMDSCGPRTAS